MRSMTGFGRESCSLDGREMILEIKTVNHRFLDIAYRMPRSLGFLEEPLKKVIQEHLARGHVDLFLGYRNTRQDAKEVLLDQSLVLAYGKAFAQMKEIANLPDDITLSTLAALPDVLTTREREEDLEVVALLAIKAAGKALAQVVVSRENEGARLTDDLANRLQTINEQLTIIESKAASSAVETHKKLQERLEALLTNTTLDPSRLLQEVAILADRSAIDEETVRLRSHMAAAYETFDLAEPVGRKLDFLVQEMHREVNTMGSKSADLVITKAVLALKGEIEKIREQVQNFE